MTFFHISTVTNLEDSGPGSFREAIEESNHNTSTIPLSITSNKDLIPYAQQIEKIISNYALPDFHGSLIVFLVNGIITLKSTLPDITSPAMIISMPQMFEVTVDCQYNDGLTVKTTTTIIGLTITNSRENGLNIRHDGNLVVLCTLAHNAGNGILITSNNNYIGLNPDNASVFTANKINNNKKNGIKLCHANGNIIVKNKILGNHKDGLHFKYASNNTIGGTVYTNADGQTNNPTGSEGRVEPSFIIPPLGNQISSNLQNGVNLNKGSNHNIFHGNFIGTSPDGNQAEGNLHNGVLINQSNFNVFKGCDFNQDPFVYYNVVSGNKLNGFLLQDANHTIIQGNFSGINAGNTFSLANGHNGLLVAGSSKNTTVGGPIPLGNNFSGNAGNGIKITDQAGNLISYNSFCGLAAFGGAVPNGKNGIHVTSCGLGIVLQTNVLSGNIKNGLKLSKYANHIMADPNLCGSTSNGESALPNGKSGLLISGNANNNFIGSQQVSVIPNSIFSGNTGNGITIQGCAHDNVIYHCNAGLSTTSNVELKNGKKAVLLSENCYQNVIVNCRISGDFVLANHCKNNKLVCNPLITEDASQIIDRSKESNLIIAYNSKTP